MHVYSLRLAGSRNIRQLVAALALALSLVAGAAAYGTTDAPGAGAVAGTQEASAHHVCWGYYWWTSRGYYDHVGWCERGYDYNWPTVYN